jgi:hypothetical protein
MLQKENAKKLMSKFTMVTDLECPAPLDKALQRTWNHADN